MAGGERLAVRTQSAKQDNAKFQIPLGRIWQMSELGRLGGAPKAALEHSSWQIVDLADRPVQRNATGRIGHGAACGGANLLAGIEGIFAQCTINRPPCPCRSRHFDQTSPSTGKSGYPIFAPRRPATWGQGTFCRCRPSESGK